MRRSTVFAGLIGAVLAVLAGASSVLAQGDIRAAAGRGPQFLVAGARPSEPPVPVDVSSVAVLRKRVSLSLENVTRAEALDAISRASGLRLVYANGVSLREGRVRLKAEEITVAAALTEVLFDAGVDVLLAPSGNAVLVKRTAVRVREAGTIVGRVTDAKSGEGLAGAEVFLEGTRWRTGTGSDGRYRLVGVEAGTYTLTARRVGYGKQGRGIAVAEGAEVTVDIALQPVATQLNEIVTTVTGEQRRVELGHVVGRVNADSLVREAPISTLSELLTARVPGLQVFQSQGTVGGRVQLQIRGPNSFNTSNEPIVIVDGVRYTTQERQTYGTGPGNVEPTSPLNDLNPNDIESIEVVKGPSAATLYGTDAANGVLVITTKRGRAGPARWNVYARGTHTEIPARHFPDIYWGWGNTADSSSCTLQKRASGQCTRLDSITVLTNPLNDPRFTIFGSKPQWEYGANVAGGQSTLHYYFSGDFSDATGPLQMPVAYAERLMQERGLVELPKEWREPNEVTHLNLRSNIAATIARGADLQLNLGYVKSNTRNIRVSENPYTVATYSADPRRPEEPYASFGSPLQFAREQSDAADRFLSGVTANWRPAGWLATRGTLGLDLTNSNLYALQRPGDNPVESGGFVEDTRTRQLSVSGDVGVTATARLGRLSARTAVGGQYTRSRHTGSSAIGSGLSLTGRLPYQALSTAMLQRYSESAVLGGYVEEMLGLNDRLFVTAALRADGASHFGNAFKAVAYPKASVSWLISQEPFVPAVPGLTELRLRYAIGASGQQPLPAAARPGFVLTNQNVEGQLQPIIRMIGLGNPDLRPERVREHEWGFDLTAFGTRLQLEATWFRRRVTDQITILNGPPAIGDKQANLGLTTHRGFEALVRTRLLESRPLSVDLTLTHANFSNKLEDLGGGFQTSSFGYVVGYPLGGRWLFRPPLGYNDANGDGILVLSELIRTDGEVYAGETVPPRSQTLTAVLGILDQRLRLSGLLERKSGFVTIAPFWCANGGAGCREAVDPSTPLEMQMWALLSSRRAQKGDYTRLREVTLAIDLPAALTRAVRLKQGSLAISARNLALWTAVKDADPESRWPRSAVGPVAPTQAQADGIPQNRVYSVRLDLGL